MHHLLQKKKNWKGQTLEISKMFNEKQEQLLKDDK